MPVIQTALFVGVDHATLGNSSGSHVGFFRSLSLPFLDALWSRDMLNELAHHDRLDSNFTFLTNHAFVLILLSVNNTMRMREIAEQIGITERAVQRIVDELVGAGYVSILKSGRRNVYALNAKKSLRHPIVKYHNVSALLKLGAPIEFEAAQA